METAHSLARCGDQNYTGEDETPTRANWKNWCGFFSSRPTPESRSESECLRPSNGFVFNKRTTIQETRFLLPDEIYNRHTNVEQGQHSDADGQPQYTIGELFYASGNASLSSMSNFLEVILNSDSRHANRLVICRNELLIGYASQIGPSVRAKRVSLQY